MRVNRCGQREVALVDLGVARLLEGTQHQVGQNALFRFARNLLRELLVHARRDVDLFGDLDDVRIASAAMAIAPVGLHCHALHRQRAYPERVAEGGGDSLKIEDTLGIRLFVNAIERANPLVLEIAGHALICRQHKLLDDAVGNIALGARDPLHQSVLVKFNHRLRQIEINGAATHPLAIEHHRQLAHQLKDIDQLVIALAQTNVSFEDEIHVGVGHAFGRADDALVQGVANNLTLWVDLHHAGEHQTVNLRAQAAQVRGKLHGQHGHGAVGEIDRSPTQSRFQVDGRAFVDIVRDIRDVDLQLEMAVLHTAHGHGIVEVACSFAVDGDDGQRAIVSPMAQLSRRDNRLKLLRLLQHFNRETMRQVELADDDLNVHAEVVFVAKNFDYAA